ncbi:hypothetical protein BC832DRAFT_188019 [Gaertneriomyces semiglobifer]|nr:hypothetical protein BC832DRAFT_188019 [Gaertneriomyces semiglobifer]
MPKLSTRLSHFKSIHKSFPSRAGGSSRSRRHFEIDKAGRFACRFFQCLVALASYYFIGKLADPEMESHDLWPTVRYTWALAVLSPVVSVVLVLQYFVSCIMKSWSSLKVLIFESLFDIVFTFLWIICILTLGIKMGSSCPPGTSKTCDYFNWVLAWGSFSALFWLTAVVFDLKSLFKGVFGWGGERLNEAEMDTEIRRLSSTTGRSGRW